MIDTKIQHGVKYIIDWGHGEVTIIARNLANGRSMVASYETAKFNFRDGYNEDDMLEVFRLADEMVERLRTDGE